MAVPIHLHNIPEHVRASQFAYHHDISSDTKHTGSQDFLQFPKSTCVLWDGTSTGPPVFLHVAQNRKPRLQLWEKVLWLIHKQTDSEGTANKILVGNLSVEDDGEDVCFHIDGLDTRQAGTSSSILLGDVMIPVQVFNSKNEDRTGSIEDYSNAVKMLEKQCSGHDPVELNNLLLVKGWCSFYTHQSADKTVSHLQFDLVTLSTVFKATPVNPVPIVPTALAKNLGGPRSLSQMQGRPKIGYLTMDHTRKLLLVLESDPKVCSLPIVGIWVSGVAMVHHPFVWTACLRYLHNEQLQDRVCTPPEGFLLVLYTSLHSKPEFYEVCTVSGKADFEFDLYTGYEITTLNKKSSNPEANSIEWELSPVRNGPKRELFDAALERMKSSDDCKRPMSSGTVNPLPSSADDIMPRMTPAPHCAKSMMVKPMVPEVSMIWNDNSPSPVHGAPPFSTSEKLSCPSSAYNAATSIQGFATGSLPSSVPGNTAAKTVPVGSNRIGAFSSSSGHCGFSVPSSGFHHQGSACESSIPRPQPPPYALSSQPVNMFSSANYSRPVMSQGSTSSAMHHPQGVHHQSEMMFGSAPHSDKPHCQPPHHYPCPEPNQPHFSAPPSSQPSQSHPRLIAPTRMHFCQPNQPGVGVQAGHLSPNPSQGVVKNPQYNGQMFQDAPFSSQRQPQLGLPCLRQPSSWPSQAAMYTGMNQGVRPAENMPYLAPLSNPHPQHPYPHAQRDASSHAKGTNPCSQIRPISCENGFGSQPLPVGNNPSRGHVGSQEPHSTSQPLNSYAQPPPSRGEQGGIIHTQIMSMAPVNSSQPASQLVTADGRGINTSGGSTQADSTSCSGKSSDDSGLSVTPDHSNPLPKTASYPEVGSTTMPVSLQGINWTGVPPEVVQLLIQQDAQLKVLMTQIQQLLAQQGSSSTTTTTPTSSAAVSTTPSTLAKETCSTAVNTTFVEPESSLQERLFNPTHCVSVQTTPQKLHHTHMNLTQSPTASPKSSLLPSSNDIAHGSSPMCHDNVATADKNQHLRTNISNEAERHLHTPYRDSAAVGADQTPFRIQHEGAAPMSSTHREDVTATSADSFHSNGSLEQVSSPPRATEVPPQTLHSTPSPQSASMCVPHLQSEDENTGEEISPDSKEYYDQLINNIRLFLNSHSENNESKDADFVPVSDQEGTQLHTLDSTLAASPFLPAYPSSGRGSSNTTLMPYINYLSLMLSSEPETSLEINAMAMKYLRDEQLTQLARLHHQPAGSSSNQLLRQALTASLNITGASGSDVSQLGMSATNMSLATRKYMEKHGLLDGGGDGESLLDANYPLRLQTDFSLAATSEGANNHSVPSSPQKSASPHHYSSPYPGGVLSPVKREVLQPQFQPSPPIAEEQESLHEERKRMLQKGRGDLGASPVLPSKPLFRWHQHHHDEDSSPVFPERYRGNTGQNLINDCSAATEDDRILDIERLKQMPKLL